MAVDPRFLAGGGNEVFTGNELLVKGALETEGGVSLLTGYPGSPIAGFFDTLGDIRDLIHEKGIRAYQANNEALAAASANGSQMLPCRVIVAMKSVGVHVAADALALANLAGAHPQGGAMVIMGEDPWCDSTQVPVDSRFICEHLRMPVLEPGDAQQVKDWVNLSFKLSQAAGLYIGYIITNAQADGGGTVRCHPNQYPDVGLRNRVELETAKIDLGRVLLPPRTWQQELRVPERFARTMEAARAIGVNRIIPAHSSLITHHSSLGFIVTGMAGPYLRAVLADAGLAGYFPMLQLGMSYPADAELVREFSRLCKTMVVVEERRSFLEKNIRDAIFASLPHDEAADIAARLYGKAFPHGLPGIPAARGLAVSLLAQYIIPLIQATDEIPAELRNGRLTEQLRQIRELSTPKLDLLQQAIVPRTPTFCPGCPHRDSAAVLLEIRRDLADPRYMKKRYRSEPVDLVAHGDTGCYTMLMFPPTEQLMHNYSGMGLGAGTGSGVDPFITNKQLVFMGDGTFFHSGQIGISNAIKANQDITFIILENKTTAMTGHQEHPGTELDVLGNRSYVQDIETIVRAMAGTSPLEVVKLSPAERPRYRAILERTILAPGVKVIIADKECGIVSQRKLQRQEKQITHKKGYLPRKTYMNITPEVCEDCLACTQQTSCPGLTTIQTDYGPKIDTDLTWCVNDGACERVRVGNDYGRGIKPCPSFEEVTIVRHRRKRYMLPHMSLDRLPDAAQVKAMDKPGDTWRIHMAGVGGMGIGLVTALLVRAGHAQGYRVVYGDKKGLAIRNGGVYSQITFIREDSSLITHHSSLGNVTANIPYGQADLLLGIDILEAARAIDARENFRVASKERTTAVLNMHKQPTVFTLLGRQDFSPETLRDEVLKRCIAERSFSRNLSELCEQRLGSKQYANILMLGVAWQLGLIPVSLSSIAWAIRDTIKREHRKNLKAFNIGRKLALEPRVLPGRPEPRTWQQLVTNKVRIIHKSRWRWRTWSARFEQIVNWAMGQMPELPEEAKYDLTLRIYDLMHYQDHRLARRYVERLIKLYCRDAAQRNYAVTAAAVVNLAKVMFIKDEPAVAWLLTRYEKKQRDIAKYSVDVANGDRLVYRHWTRPEFGIGPLRFRFGFKAHPWMLRMLRGCKFLRYLPGWHRRDTAFRDWYIGLLDRVSLAGDEAYAQALRMVRCPEAVKGYREIRYPLMDKAMATAEEELAGGRASTAPPKASILDVIRRPFHA